MFLWLTEQKENPTYIFHLKCKLKGRYAAARSRHSGRHIHRRIMQAGSRTLREGICSAARARGVAFNNPACGILFVCLQWILSSVCLRARRKCSVCVCVCGLTPVYRCVCASVILRRFPNRPSGHKFRTRSLAGKLYGKASLSELFLRLWVEK